MLKFSLRRIATGVALLFTVCTITYFLLYLGSGTIARAIMGATATKTDIARFNHSHGLDRSFVESYAGWLSHAVRGDLGQPWTFPQPVTTLLLSRMSVTLTLVVLSLLISATLALILGVTAAVKGGWIDRAVQMLALSGIAIPNFLAAFALVALFAVQRPWFNAVGWVAPSEDFGGFLKSAVLPISAIAFGGIVSLAQQIRGAVLDTLQNDYVRTLRACGLSYRRVVLRHVLRNAAAPALSIVGLQFIGMLGGIVIIEQLFAIPGLGQFSVQATQIRDIPAVMGLVTMMAGVVLIVNLVIDLLSAALNPKVRLS